MINIIADDKVISVKDLDPKKFQDINWLTGLYLKHFLTKNYVKRYQTIQKIIGDDSFDIPLMRFFANLLKYEVILSIGRFQYFSSSDFWEGDHVYFK